MKQRKHARSTRRHSSNSTRDVGATVDVRIERILPGGLGLAHGFGRTILVALAAPGDHLRVRINRVQGHVAFASIAEILTPSSPDRIEPPCPYFGRCGGCDFQQLNYEAQLASKVEIIRDCLRRIARIEPPASIPIQRSPAVWQYRSRAAWQYDRAAQVFGYFERGSHRVCDVIECPVVVPALQETLSELRQEVRLSSLPDDVSEFQAVAGDDAVALTPPVWSTHPREATRAIAGERYRFDADCFFQINHGLLEPLVAEALKHVETIDDGSEVKNVAAKSAGVIDEARAIDDVGAIDNTRALKLDAVEVDGIAVDLYCGVGLFTLPLARRFKGVVGVEGNALACEYARKNLAGARLANARIETSSVGAWLTEHAQELAPVDFVLLDPPRTGVEAEAIAGLKRLRPRRIAYVSCDPATLARDLKILLEDKYTLDSLAAFDMFPQTHHVETIAHLALREPQG